MARSNRLVADPAPPQVELKHHLFRRRFFGCGHGNLVEADTAA